MENDSFVNDFFKAVLTLKTPEECSNFFNAACTPKEIQSIARRYAVAKMLYEKHVYSDIVRETGISTAIISRVSRSDNSGYTVAFDRIKK